MDDGEDDEVEYEYEVEPLLPAPFNPLAVGAHLCLAASGVAECVGHLMHGLAMEFGRASNLRLSNWKAKDQGVKFAAEVLKDLSGLDSQG